MKRHINKIVTSETMLLASQATVSTSTSSESEHVHLESAGNDTPCNSSDPLMA